MNTVTRLVSHPLFKLLVSDDRQPSVRAIVLVADVVMVVGTLLIGIGVISNSSIVVNFLFSVAQNGCLLALLTPLMMALAATTYTMQMIRKVNSFDQFRLMPIMPAEMVGILTLRVLHRARLFLAGGAVLLGLATVALGLQPQWAIRIDEAFSTQNTQATPWDEIEPTTVEYLVHGSFWGAVNFGLCLLMPLGTVIGVFYAVALRSTDASTVFAVGTLFLLMLILGGVFLSVMAQTHIRDARLYSLNFGSVLISVMCCPVPILAAMAGFFWAGVRAYRGRQN